MHCEYGIHVYAPREYPNVRESVVPALLGLVLIQKAGVDSIRLHQHGGITVVLFYSLLLKLGREGFLVLLGHLSYLFEHKT